MLNIFRTKTYLKEYRKIKFSDKHYTKYISYLGLLLNDIKLPPEALDHPLKGNYESFYEFHVSGDVLVLYLIEDGYLKLIRIGSHSQVFN